jgi:hypothetical protein
MTVTVQDNGLSAPMERVSGARMAAVKPHGWFHAALVMAGVSLSTNKVNGYQ